MTRFLVKLAVAGFVANAAWRVGSAYLVFYRFHDSVVETSQYRGRKSDEELRQRIVELAAEFDVPMAADGVMVATERNHTIVDGSYVAPIDLAPGYVYGWPFALHVDTPTERPKRLGDGLAPR